MNASLLSKLFGKEKRWRGPCLVIINADAQIQSTGADSIVQGGLKSFAPRLVTGRVQADWACYLPDDAAVLLVQKTVVRQATGEDVVKLNVMIADAAYIAAIEFSDLEPLRSLGISPPE